MSKTVRWLLQLLKPYKAQVLLGGLLVALTVLGNVGLLATSGRLISEAALQPEILLLMPLITGVRFFGIGRALARYAERLLNHNIAFRILGHLREDLYKRLEPLIPDDFPSYSQGKLYNQFISDIDTLQYFYLKSVSVPLGSLIVYSVCAFFVACYDRRLVLLLCIGQLVAGIVVPLWVVRGEHAKKHQLMTIEESLSEQFLEYKQGLVDVHIFGKLSTIQAELHKKIKAMMTMQYQMSLRKKLTNRLVFFISRLTMLVALWMLVAPLINRQVDGVDIAMLALLILASFEGIMQMPEAVLQMDASIAAAENISEVYQKSPSKKEGATCNPTSFDIQAEHVDFHYHKANYQLIEDLNLEIPHGTHIALVGESGSGKTSIAHLLSGLWHIDSGRLQLGGCDYSTLDEKQMHQWIACVDQESYFFYTSVRENFQLANVQVTDEQIWEALALVELEETIRKLPEGLNTILAENASMLSGGQRQRLAIARMIIQNPKIVILDEALQKLDKYMAERIFKRLLKWGENRTIVVISHSLRLLNMLDFSYLIMYGKIIEKGTHEDLIRRKNGYYRALYDIEQSQF